MERYVHDVETHNLASPAEIVGILGRALNPKSVVDIGCGTGTFLHQFKKAGVDRVLGIDGPWVNRELLAANLDSNEFREKNLEEPINLGEKFDLAVCVEVAEHLDEKYADALITSLTGLSNVILFSAAIPYQDGQNHLNEQWMNYWAQKFDAHGYASRDLIRPMIWNNGKIQWWYRQNIFLVYNRQAPPDLRLLEEYQGTGINSYVHPDLYLKKSKRLEEILTGRQSFLFYIKLIVKKLLRIVKPGSK